MAKKRQKSVRGSALGNRRLMLSLNAKLNACVGKYLRARERRCAPRPPLHSLLAEDCAEITGDSTSKACSHDRGQGPEQARDATRSPVQAPGRARAKVEGKKVE